MDSTKSLKKHTKKSVPKSKHQKMVEMRLKQWYNSTYKKLQVETFFYHAKNGESLLTLRQHHPENTSSSKKAFGDFIIFNSSNIDKLINHLQMMKKKCGSKKKITRSNIIIDEWDIHSTQSSHRRIISELIAKEMEKIFSDVVYTKCSGCINQLENQLAHKLCLTPIEEKIDTCFPVMMDKINIDTFTKLSKEILLNDDEWISLTKHTLVNLLSI